MPVHGLIRLAHLAQAEVVRPALQFPVEPTDLLPLVKPGPSATGQFADLATESLDHFRRRTRPYVGLARLRRIAPADRVAQKVERLLFTSVVRPAIVCGLPWGRPSLRA